MKSRYFLPLWICLLSLASCRIEPPKVTLPFYGKRLGTQEVIKNGEKVTDTIYATVPSFKFTSMNGEEITNNTFKGKMYVANFFFTSCQTICPMTQRNLLKVQEKYKGLKDFHIVSHTVDPNTDSLSVLKEYAKKLGADEKLWYFVRASEEYTYKIAEQGYYATAMRDASSPDGFSHSGAYILVDKQQRIRGMYDGTKDKGVNQLIKDIDILSKE